MKHATTAFVRRIRSLALVVVLAAIARPHDFIVGGGTSPGAPGDPGAGQGPCNNGSGGDPTGNGDADPVDLHRGEFLLQRDDVFLASRGPAVDVRFNYRSRSAFNGPYGYGWDMAYARRIRRLAGGDLVVLRGNNMKVPYTHQGGGLYTGPVGVESTIVLEIDGTYTLTGKHGDRERYDADGKLVVVEDREGNAVTLTYDPAGKLPVIGPSDYFVGQSTGIVLREWRLIQITDAIGRTVDFAYDVNGRLESIEYLGRTVSYGYDSQGNLTSVTMPATTQFPSGTTTTYGYSNHNLTSITDAKGQTYLTNVYSASTDRISTQTFGGATSIFAYGTDVGGNAVTDVQDRNGNDTRYTFNAAGQITKIEQFTDGVPASEPPSYVNTRTYDAAGRLIREVFPRGNSIEFAYSQGDLVEWRRKPIGATPFVPGPNDIVTAVTYESLFRLVQTIVDPLGRTTTFTYDYQLGEPAKGRLRRVTYPTVAGGTPELTLTYNAYGQLETFVDANGLTTRRTYHAATGYLHQSTEAFGTVSAATTEFTYDAAGNPTSRKDPNGNLAAFEFDAQDNLTRIVGPSPFFYQVHYRYDANGNVRQIDQQAVDTAPGAQPALGTVSATDDWRSTVLAYTVRDELQSFVDDLGNMTSYTYDGNGNELTTQDADGFVTTFVPNELNRPWKVLDAATPAGVTEFEYDLNGNVSTIRDAKGNPTTYLYDDFDRKTRATYADGSFEQFAYDKLSKLTSRTTPGNSLIVYSYDELDRLTGKTTPSETSTYVYDLGGRLTSATDADAALSFAYDALDRPITATTAITGLATPFVVQYGYDKHGNRKSMTYPDGFRLTYGHDAVHRLTTITRAAIVVQGTGGVQGITPAQQLARLTYDALGRRKSLLRLNGVRTTYTHDAGDRLTDVVHTNSASAVIESFAYTFDGRGNRETAVDADGSHSFGYDQLSQTTSATHPVGHPFPNASSLYDAVGNRISRTEGAATTPYGVNTLNQYTTVGPATLQHDGDGNLDADGSATYDYDAERRLVSMVGATATATFAHDALGRRVRQTINGVTSYFVQDGADILVEANAAGATVARFVHGPLIDEPLLVDRGSFRAYYLGDGASSVRRVVNPGQATIERYRYDDFGTPQILDGAGVPIGSSSFGNRFTFAGREYHADLGIYDYRARAYSPKLGRFLQRDPFGYFDDINLYRFVGNNPLTLFDPYGFDKGVGQPGFGESLIPVWGSGRAAIDDFQNGDWGWGLLNTGLAITDVFMVKALVTAGGKLLFKGGAKAVASSGKTTVYSAVENGTTKYVGITDDLASRAAAHASQKGIAIAPLPGLTNLARADARAIEQVLIEHYGLGKNGGSLLNKINSIAKNNPIYDDAIKRGRELLKQAGYPGFDDPAFSPGLLAWLGGRELFGAALGSDCE